MEIPKQNCLICGKDTGTKIVCDDCRVALTRSQIIKFDRIFQHMVIELFGNKCIDCDRSAETESGELCAAHLQGKGALGEARYDLACAVCRCADCHNKDHTGEIKKVPHEKKLPKETVKRQKKFKKPPLCKMGGCPYYALEKGLCCKHL